MKDETIKEKFDKLFEAHQQAKFIIGQFEASNQSLTEQNQKLVNEAVKMREAFEELLESSYKYAHEDSNREDWRRKAGLTINEKGEG